jgi:AcrR family transcriptional regulator
MASLKSAAKKSRAKPVRRKRRSSAAVMTLLLDAAAEEFQEAGFGGATTAAIAKRADVTEAQLFRYFDSKADIFQAAIFKPLSQHLARFNEQHMNGIEDGGSIRDKAQLYIGELQNFIAEHSRMFLSLIVAEAYASGSTQGVAGLEGLKSYFDRGAQSMRSRTGAQVPVAPELMVRVSFAAVLASVLFKDWIFPKGLARDKEISAAIIEFVIDGISANEDPGLNKKR